MNVGGPHIGTPSDPPVGTLWDLDGPSIALLLEVLGKGVKVGKRLLVS